MSFLFNWALRQSCTDCDREDQTPTCLIINYRDFNRYGSELQDRVDQKLTDVYTIALTYEKEFTPHQLSSCGLSRP